MKLKLAAIAGVAALAGGSFLAVQHPAPVKHVSAPHVQIRKGCETVDMTIKVKMGMPADYVLVFCGANIANQYVTCIRDSYQLPQPGEVMRGCTTQPYPKGYPVPAP